MYGYPKAYFRMFSIGHFHGVGDSASTEPICFTLDYMLDYPRYCQITLSAESII